MGGVRRKRIDLDPDKWDVAPLPWADDQRALDYFTATDHHRYGWAGLVLSQLLNLNRSIDKAQFCSQWCAAALGLPSPATYSPRTLVELCAHLNAFPAAA